MPAQQAVVALVPVYVLQAEIGETEQDVRPRPHEGSLQGQLVGKPFVVGIVERDQRVARFGYPTVTSRPDAPMRPHHIADPIAIWLEDSLGVVSGSVIHDDDFVSR